LSKSDSNFSQQELAEIRQRFYNLHIVRPKANWAGMFIVALLIVLLAIVIVAILECNFGHMPCAPTIMPAVSCSSPSSGTDRSTPGGSFFEIPVRATCMSPLHESHGDLFSPLLTTDDRSIPTCSGPSADRRLNHSSRQDAKTQRRDQNIKDQRSKLWTARWIGPGV
jgi:hypothetical protein